MHGEASSSSNTVRYLDWSSGVVVSSENHFQNRLCCLRNIGGHIMKNPFVGFQVLLCVRLEGTPQEAKHILIPVLFSPIFILHGVGILFSTLKLVEKIVILLRSGDSTGIAILEYYVGCLRLLLSACLVGGLPMKEVEKSRLAFIIVWVLGGSEGLFAQKTLEITDNVLASYKNQGGYDLLERTKAHGPKGIALECTLQSHPNMLILGEEVAGSKVTLFDITTQICNAVKDRATQGYYNSSL